MVNVTYPNSISLMAILTRPQVLYHAKAITNENPPTRFLAYNWIPTRQGIEGADPLNSDYWACLDWECLD